jgi:hypothetical protein
MNKNYPIIVFVGLLFLALILSNLYFFKKTLDLNEEVSRLFELELLISDMKIEHQNEVENIRKTYEDEIARLNNDYARKFETVKKALNAFEYELEEFYKNRHILKEDYLENIRKIQEVRDELENAK